MMFHFNLHHITLTLIGYLSNIFASSGNGITFSHVELPKNKYFEVILNFYL